MSGEWITPLIMIKNTIIVWLGQVRHITAQNWFEKVRYNAGYLASYPAGHPARGPPGHPMCCSAVEHLERRLYCQKCYRCLGTNSIEPIINEIDFIVFILLFFGLLDTPQNISPDALLLNSPWDALQDALLDALMDRSPKTLPYTSPFQTNFEQ